jgi:FkbM family methyltransferase
MNPINSLKASLLNLVLNILKQSKNQAVWEDVYRLSLRKMNYGNGSEFQESGELAMLQHIKRALGDVNPITVFDVGANIGKYALELAKYFGTKATIYSFEPSAKTYELFCKNTQGVASIIPNNIGFSDKPSKLILYTNTDGSGLASLYQRNLDHYNISMNQQEQIELSTIDQFTQELGIKHINFLKLDIEGHELKALHGAQHIINSGAVDFIQFEFGGCNIDSRTYFQDFFYLLKDRYRFFRILEDGLLELTVYKETYEIFTTVNYLAVRKGLAFYTDAQR